MPLSWDKGVTINACPMVATGGFIRCKNVTTQTGAVAVLDSGSRSGTLTVSWYGKIDASCQTGVWQVLRWNGWR
jgi:hypothetical protein